MLLALLFGAAAFAADPFYLGTWKISSAAAAPWADAQTLKRDSAEVKSLVGRTITFEPKAVRGPRGLGCAEPKYDVRDYPADMLFQGMFGETHAPDQSVDPARLPLRAAKARAFDATTAAFALNNYIYTLKKQR